ncbi:MAG TPA: RsmE family RNA methyltransferase [Chitinophagales bacterium]|nr:RsmE family RNA methyltransferase [Chitinophagales bacterium]
MFYAPQLREQCYYLGEEESRHCSQVLRQKVGDVVLLTDGLGGRYEAKLTEVLPKRCCFVITEALPEYNVPSARLHLGVAPTKSMERFEWFLEKATEIGVTDITPIFTQRTERSRLRLDRLEKIVVSAMKQCMTCYLPHLHEPVELLRLLKDDNLLSGYSQRFIPYVNPDNGTIAQYYQKKQHTFILIGPEGDFTAQEVGAALAKNFVPISLGKNRLRTETAAIVCCHTVRLLEELAG